MATAADVAAIAKQVCAKFTTGYRGLVTVGHITFELGDRGYCSEFVRECNEAALGLRDHALGGKYFGSNARDTERLLRTHKTQVKFPAALPGDIVCFNIGGGLYGHIGIHLDPNHFAENTSDVRRGPGFVVSHYDVIGRDRISGTYHLPEFGEEAPLTDKVKVFMEDGTEVACRARLEDAVTRCDLRPLAEKLGMTLDVSQWDKHIIGLREKGD